MNQKGAEKDIYLGENAKKVEQYFFVRKLIIFASWFVQILGAASIISNITSMALLGEKKKINNRNLMSFPKVHKANILIGIKIRF